MFCFKATGKPLSVLEREGWTSRDMIDAATLGWLDAKLEAEAIDAIRGNR